MEIENFYKDKRVLITGHSGFKGSWLVSELLMFGTKICGVSLKPNTTPSLFNLLELEKQIDNNYVDIRDYKKLQLIFDNFKPEIVFHLAAQPLVIDSYKNPLYTYETNVMGTVNVCECIRNCESVKSFVNITTDKVYENIEKENHYYREDEKLNGYDPYSNSKSCSELVTQSYTKSFFNDLGISVSTCRAGNVIGGGDFSENRIIPDCVRSALSGKTMIVRNPNSVRPYQHVLEADTFYLLVGMEQYENIKFASHYNIGPEDGDCYSTGELVKLFASKWNDFDYEFKNTNGPHEANFLKLDISKAKDTFNWRPRWNVEKAVDKVIEFTKAYKENKAIKEIVEKQIREYIDE